MAYMCNSVTAQWPYMTGVTPRIASLAAQHGFSIPEGDYLTDSSANFAYFWYITWDKLDSIWMGMIIQNSKSNVHLIAYYGAMTVGTRLAPFCYKKSTISRFTLQMVLCSNCSYIPGEYKSHGTWVQCFHVRVTIKYWGILQIVPRKV